MVQKGHKRSDKIKKEELNMKLLSIGNSFSQNAHRFLHELAAQNGLDIETSNLFIGGCSLETHYDNYINDNAFYDLEPNGGAAVRKISIKEALKLDAWDAVTFQQASRFSGMIETFEPYLSSLACVVKNTCPDAKLYFHQTWAYEIDRQSSEYLNYNNDQRQMFDSIVKASTEAAKLIGAGLIPVGSVIQYLRENTPEFDYKNGALSLCRDGSHLTDDYGNFAAAATWLRALTGITVKAAGFHDFDVKLLQVILDAVNKM